MQELLQQIDSEYYRSALLLFVRTEIERLRQGRSALIDVKRPSEDPLGTPDSTDNHVPSLGSQALDRAYSWEMDDTG
jgi:hypothetical protein